MTLDPKVEDAVFALTRAQTFSALTGDEHRQLQRDIVTSYLAALPPPPQGEPVTEALIDAQALANMVIVAGTTISEGTNGPVSTYNPLAQRARDLVRKIEAALSAQPTAGWRETQPTEAQLLDAFYIGDFDQHTIIKVRGIIRELFRNAALTPPPPANTGEALDRNETIKGEVGKEGWDYDPANAGGKDRPNG